jgi:hypothetical protein
MAMRITFNPGVMNTSPISPVSRVVRKKRSPFADKVEADSTTPTPVATSVSELGALLAREETVEEKDYKKKDPLWNLMLNL